MANRKVNRTLEEVTAVVIYINPDTMETQECTWMFEAHTKPEKFYTSNAPEGFTFLKEKSREVKTVKYTMLEQQFIENATRQEI